MGTWKGEEASDWAGEQNQKQTAGSRGSISLCLRMNFLKKGQLVNEMHRPVNSLTGIVKHVPLLREEATHQVGGRF